MHATSILTVAKCSPDTVAAADSITDRRRTGVCRSGANGSPPATVRTSRTRTLLLSLLCDDRPAHPSAATADGEQLFGRRRLQRVLCALLQYLLQAATACLQSG